MSPGSFSWRSSSALTTVEDVSNRRAKLWEVELERRVCDVDNVVAARLERQRRRFVEERFAASSQGVRTVVSKPGPKTVRNPSRSSAISVPKKKQPSASTLTSCYEQLLQLQVELLNILQSFERDLSETSQARSVRREVLVKPQVNLSSLKEVDSVCRSELESVRPECFKPSVPALVVQRVVKVHGTINTAVMTFLLAVFQQRATISKRDGVNTREVVEDLLDTICLLCGIVGNLKRHSGAKVGRHREPVHLDILDWIVTNRQNVVAGLVAVASIETTQTQVLATGLIVEKSRVEKIPSVTEDAVSESLLDESVEIKSKKPNSPPSVETKAEFKPASASKFLFPPEKPKKDKEYWKVVEHAAGQLIDDIMENVDAFIAKAEEDAIRKVLDQELRS